MADTVRLEITVDDKGSPVIKTMTENLDKWSAKAGEASEGQKKLNKIAEEATQVFNNLGMQSGALVGHLASMAGPVVLLGGTLAGGLVAGALAAADSFQKFAFQVRDLSYLSGGSAQATASLISALEDLSVDSGTVEVGINRMSQAAAKGDPALAQLGVTMRDGVGGPVKDGLTLFYETIDALGAMGNEVERNQLAQSIFGRGWTSLVPVIAKGSTALKELGAENALLGKTMSEEGILRAQEYKTALNDLKDVGEGFVIAWGGRVIPVVTAVVTAMTPAPVLIHETATAWEEHVLELNNVQRSTVTLDEAEGRLMASTINQKNHTKALAKGTAELSAETERRLKLETQLASLEAQTASARAGSVISSPEARIAAEEAAAVKAADAKLKATLNDITLARAKTDKNEQGKLDDIEVEARRLRNAEVAKARVESEEKIRGEQKKTVDQNIAGEVAAAEEEIRLNNLMQKNTNETEAASIKAIEDGNQKNIDGAVKVADAEIALDEKVLQYENEATAKKVALRDSTTEGELRAIETERQAIAVAAEEGYLTREQAEQKYTELTHKERDIRVKGDKDALADELEATTNFYDKVSVALKINTRDYEDQNQRMVRITGEFAKAATQTLDDFFFNAITGKFESLGDVVKNFGYSLLRIGTSEASKSIFSSLFGGSGGGGTDWLDIAKNVYGGVSTTVGAVTSFLGAFDTGKWKVPEGQSGAAPATTGSRWARTGNTKAAGWAVLHPGEMVVPADEAELLRQIIEAYGGTSFNDLGNILSAEGGGDKTNTGGMMGGQFGALSADQRSALSGMSLGARGLGFGLGLAGISTLGLGAISTAIAGVLGIDSLLGVDNPVGWGLIDEATISEIGAIHGAYAAEAARAANNQATVANATETKNAMDAADARDAAVGARSAEATNQSGAESSARSNTGDPTSATMGNEAAAAAAAAADAAMGGRDSEGGPSAGKGGENDGTTDSNSNSGADHDGTFATGGLFRTSGRTRMTVGEAGTETVAVLKNPREMVGGGGGMVVNLFNSGVIGNQLPDALMREFQKELDRRAGRRVRY